MNEILLLTCRCIQQDAFGQFVQRSSLMICHAFEHFKLYSPQGICFQSENKGIADIEKIVRCNPGSYRIKILSLQRIIHHSLVIRIRIQLRLKWRLWPTMKRGFDPLHLHIRTLHDPDRDRRSTLLDPTFCPFGDGFLPRERVWDVSLQHNSSSH